MSKNQESSFVRVRTELSKLPVEVREAVKAILTEDLAHNAYATVNWFETANFKVAETVLKYAEATIRQRQKDRLVADSPDSVPVSEALQAGAEG